MKNDTTVSVSAAGGALGVIAVFIGEQFVAIPSPVAAAAAVLSTAVLGLLLPRS